MKKLASAALMLFIAVAISGCATNMTHQQLTAGTDNQEIWQVDAPSQQVFRAYRDLMRNKINGSWLSDESGMEFAGQYYGPAAELSLGLMSNPLARWEYLHFEMDETDGRTVVKVWYLDDKWQQRLSEYKALLPTTVVRQSDADVEHAS